jgi:hypothetical protein
MCGIKVNMQVRCDTRHQLAAPGFESRQGKLFILLKYPDETRYAGFSFIIFVSKMATWILVKLLKNH